MNSGTLLWIIIFAIAAATFMGVAAVVTIKGVGDLKVLLHHPDDDGVDEV